MQQRLRGSWSSFSSSSGEQNMGSHLSALTLAVCSLWVRWSSCSSSSSEGVVVFVAQNGFALRLNQYSTAYYAGTALVRAVCSSSQDADVFATVRCSGWARSQADRPLVVTFKALLRVQGL